MKDRPLISIIIPAYNAAGFIRETIQSVVTQSYDNWELIVVDDGSTDQTAAIVNEFVNNRRVRLFQKPNTGVADSRNFGYKHSCGSWCCFLDADDRLKPDCLERRVFHLQENVKFYHNDIALIDSNGEETGGIKRGLSGHVLDDLLIWKRTVIPGPSSIFLAKEVFDTVGGFDPAFSTAADQDFFFRTAALFPVQRIPEVLTLYRDHLEGMHRDIALMERDHIAVYHKAARNNLFRSFWFRKKCFAGLYFILAGNWWKDGESKLRAVWFVLLMLMTYPPAIVMVFQRLIRGAQ